MRVAQAAGMETALRALDVILGSHGRHTGCLVPRHHWRDVDGKPEREVSWHRALSSSRSGTDLARLVRLLDERHSDEIHVGLAQRDRRIADGGPVASPILWARVEGKEQLKRARGFKFLPTMVLAEGSSTRRLLIWWLSEPLDYFATQEANRKLAYHFGATQKYGTPENLRIPLPGTCLREGRARPVPIVVARLVPSMGPGLGIVARLKEPPDQDAWKNNDVRTVSRAALAPMPASLDAAIDRADIEKDEAT